MAKLRQTLRSQVGSLERVAARVAGFRGYLEQDERRRSDQRVRDHGASRLEGVVGALRERVARTASEERGETEELIACVEKLRSEIRFADRGYSGFFDEAKLDDGAALDAVYAQDERIALQLEELAARVADADVAAALLRGSVKRLGLALADRRNAILELGSA